MKLTLHGGFGEKGRTSVGVEAGDCRLIFDVGINTSVARLDPDYYPRISPAELAATDAILITHAHEDHIAGLGWCIANGFRGRILMTREARAEADACWAAYATQTERERAEAADWEAVSAGDTLNIGPFTLKTGRSGHIAGGFWIHAAAGGETFGYCGDVVPASPAFAMDPMPACDLIAIDASYGDDAVPFGERVRAIRDWLKAHPEGAILPTPLYGRSLELFACIDSPLALAPGMREALVEQIAAHEWLREGVADGLRSKLAQARDWHAGEAMPRAALLCHDGMGMAGPSRELLFAAERIGHPVLFTGHLPGGSPGERMHAQGRADWARLPTHPTLPDNLALVAATGARSVLGHSCEQAKLEALKPHLPGLMVEARTGDVLEPETV